jgi:AcrR family transcriptional regulator
VSTPYEEGGRSRQKRRTRDALVAAARELVAAGEAVTVEGAAAAASISRTTAYRYFPSERALLPDDAPEDPRARLDAVVEAFTAMIVDTEPQQRTMLRLSLERDTESELPLRQGRAIGWIHEALEGRVPLSDAQLRALVIAVRATTGIEALVWLLDVVGLSRTEARTLMRWSAGALLDGALHEPPPQVGRNRSRRDEGAFRQGVPPTQ